MPKKLSRTAQKTIDLATSLSDDDLVAIIKNTPNWFSAVKTVEPEKTQYPSDPVEFMRDTLGYTMWPKLQAICESVRDNHNTVVSSGFGTGKSISAAAIACWFLCTFDPAVVITLAPTFAQVQGIVWQYIRQAGRKARLPGEILQTPRWTISDTKLAYGLSPRKTTDEDMSTLQGRHSKNQLVIMDEGAGLPRKIWETVMGLSVSENNRTLVIGNPIGRSGPFFEASQSPNWHSITISCLEHPNVTEGKELIPGAVSRQWVEDRSTEWASPCDPYTLGGVHLWWCDKWVFPQPIFTAKVLGIAPEEDEDQLIKTAWVVNAENMEVPEGDVVTISCDPAPRGGDDTAMAARSGNKILWVKRKKTFSTNEIVNLIKTEMESSGANRVNVDGTGNGIGVVDGCRLEDITVLDVNSSNSAVQKKRFANKRSEMWWNLREALRRGLIQLPKDTMLEADLTSIRVKENELHGRILLEEKEETAKRIKRSPDTGDATALLFTSVNTGVEIDVESLQKALTKPQLSQQATSRWTVVSSRRSGSRWKG